ncbi:sigma-70 family RNA polymerase sigma factor [Amycolatopsis sp. BJA-103]|uniref:sigma-70 family RNA polymerase sigma factor n=1 Tax=Amycolatopsis sp. BJA-103 TaxID=1911175 RepID=UPI000CADD574|nr:sigma-70 family RNA polymerase sigma factor [Amycolatopsis sp. BJA-103]PNE16455.1 hypothetical protein B1H26_24670 [Amycolatopsis sp. BJA-103]
MDSPTDRELLSAKPGSEAEARAVFEQFVRRHRDAAWKIALSVTRSPELAAEAMQDAFLVAWRGREQAPAHVSISTWLHVTVMNAARRVDRLDRVANRASPVGELPDIPTPDIANQVASRVDFEAALGRLAADQRAALALVYLGYSELEAAHQLQVSPSTFKRRLAKARESLAQASPQLEQRDRPGTSQPTRSHKPATWYFGPAETEPDFPETSLTKVYEGLDRLFSKLGPPPDDLLADGTDRTPR